MLRLCVLCCALLFTCGCASDPQWAEFWKDVRGDNMKMRYNSSELSDMKAPSGRTTVRE